MCTWEQETRPPETERVPARDERNPGKSEGKTSATGAGCTGEICLFTFLLRKSFLLEFVEQIFSFHCIKLKIKNCFALCSSISLYL